MPGAIWLISIAALRPMMLPSSTLIPVMVETLYLLNEVRLSSRTTCTCWLAGLGYKSSPLALQFLG